MTNAGDESLRRQFNPVSVLSRDLQICPDDRVLYPPGHTMGALLAARPIYPNWYSHEVAAAYGDIDSFDSAREFVEARDISYVIAPTKGIEVPAGPQATITELAQAMGYEQASLNGWSVYALAGSRRC
jgi:hypothetical protein